MGLSRQSKAAAFRRAVVYMLPVTISCASQMHTKDTSIPSASRKFAPSNESGALVKSNASLFVDKGTGATEVTQPILVNHLPDDSGLLRGGFRVSQPLLDIRQKIIAQSHLHFKVCSGHDGEEIAEGQRRCM